MATLSDFSEDERDLILDAPGAVLMAAIVADKRPGPVKLFKQLAAGTKMIRVSRSDENPFVRDVALAVVERDSPGSRLPDADEAVSTALDQTKRALTLLQAKPDGDAEEYGTWLVGIATWAVESAKSKSGGFFGRKAAIKLGERTFIERLTEVVKG